MFTRRASFESNSSSSHSISMTSGTTYDDTIPIDPIDGKVHISFGEFGWEWEKHTDAKTKASYVATYVFNYKTEKEQQLLTKVIQEFCGAEVVYNKINDEYDPKGYIDHQSSDDSNKGLNAIDFTEENIKKFIFCKNSFLLTGNDNSIIPPNIWQKVIDKNKIKYEFEIEGYIFSLASIKPDRDVDWGILAAIHSFLDTINHTSFSDGYYELDYHLYGRGDIKKREKTHTEETLDNLYRHLKKNSEWYDFMLTFGKQDAQYDEKGNFKNYLWRSEKWIPCRIRKV